MSIENHVRLTSYASLAAVATTGFIAEAQADLMIFDVGTTFTLQPVLDFGGGPTFSSSTFRGTLELEDLGQTMTFFGVRFAGSNSTNPADFVDFSVWTANFDKGTGGIAVSAKKGDKAVHFGPGDEVGKANKGNSYALGGMDKSKGKSGGQFSFDKGVMDGQTYIGFGVPAEGLGMESTIFGWVDLTIGEDENGKLTLTINRWAYESDPMASAQIPGGNPVPGVGGLLGLAMGAAGVRRRRERVA